MKPFRPAFWLASVLLLEGSSLMAAELDWSSVTWPTNTTSANLSETYTNVDGSGADLSFDFPTTGTPPNADAGSQNPETSAFGPFPGDGPNFTPKISTVDTSDDALLLFVDFTPGNPNEYVTLDIDFTNNMTGDALTVSEVSLTVYDIDFGTNDFSDFVIILGETKDGDIIAPTNVTDSPPFNDRSIGFPGDFTGTIYEDSANTALLQESAVIGLSANATTDGASATWDFGDQEIVGLVMVYTNSSLGPNNPDGQAISLGNVFFTVVPEAETYWAAFALFLLLGGFTWRKYRTVR